MILTFRFEVYVLRVCLWWPGDDFAREKRTLEPENKEGENAIWDLMKEIITEFEFLVLPRRPMNDGND